VCEYIDIVEVKRLVTGATGFGDDLGHLVDLSLRTTEGTELDRDINVRFWLGLFADIPSSLRAYGRAYPCCS